MGILGFGNKNKVERLEQENKAQRERIKQLEDLCEEKDSHFIQLMSDGLKKGSSLAGRHMADRKSFLKGK